MATATSPSPRHRIIGYVLGSRDQDFRRIDSAKLTHINYAFANVKDMRAASTATASPGWTRGTEASTSAASRADSRSIVMVA